MIGDKKICPACGKEFIQKRARQKYCDNPHYKPCPICGKMILMKYPGDPAPACSPECRKKLRELHKKEKSKVVTDERTTERDKASTKTVHLFSVNNKPSDEPNLKRSQGDSSDTKLKDLSAPKIPESPKQMFNETYEPLDDDDYTSKTRSPKITLIWNEDGENHHHVIYQYNQDLMGFKTNHEYDIDIIRNPSSTHYGYVIRAFDENKELIEMPTSSFIMVNRYFKVAK